MRCRLSHGAVAFEGGDPTGGIRQRSGEVAVAQHNRSGVHVRGGNHVGEHGSGRNLIEAIPSGH